MASALLDSIFQIIQSSEPITTHEISKLLEKQNIFATKALINSILYKELRALVKRDKNEKGIPVWRVKRKSFAASSGLEVLLYTELIDHKIITPYNSQQDFTVKNTKNNKVYHLDIAIRIGLNKFNIEVDGFDHIRADALSSIERQITEEGPNVEIEIDWMDNEKSYIAYAEINTKKVYKWCGDHIDWCIRYHEELLWPKDITRNIWLIEKGWKVMRFWNAQITKNSNLCTIEIKEWLQG